MIFRFFHSIWWFFVENVEILMKFMRISIFSSKKAPSRVKKSENQKFLISGCYILYEVEAYQKLSKSLHGRKRVFKPRIFTNWDFCIDGTDFESKSRIFMTKIRAKSEIFEIPSTLASCNFFLSGRMKISGPAF